MGAGTPRTLRVHWMLHELRLDYETRPVGARTSSYAVTEFSRLNPLHKIPVLQDGEFTLRRLGGALEPAEPLIR